MQFAVSQAAAAARVEASGDDGLRRGKRVEHQITRHPWSKGNNSRAGVEVSS